MIDTNLWEQWINDQPEHIKKVCLDYPLGAKFWHNGVQVQVTGYNQDGTLDLHICSDSFFPQEFLHNVNPEELSLTPELKAKVPVPKKRLRKNK